jgi:curved DNA-binding protein CbpA
MDPHAVLGVSADADDEAISAAYRKLAKRYHPDHRPDDDEAVVQMAEINLAYALLRDSQAEMHARRSPAPPAPATTGEIRAALGAELTGQLQPGETVTVVTDAATWDSFRVRLALSDQRLLWLRDDAPTDRVRSLKWRAIQSVEGRLKRPRRRVGELRVQPVSGRRVSFSELDPDALRVLLLAARKHVPA